VSYTFFYTVVHAYDDEEDFWSPLVSFVPFPKEGSVLSGWWVPSYFKKRMWPSRYSDVLCNFSRTVSIFSMNGYLSIFQRKCGSKEETTMPRPSTKDISVWWQYSSFTTQTLHPNQKGRIVPPFSWILEYTSMALLELGSTNPMAMDRKVRLLLL
jgi:hypothetical protein